VESRPDSAKRRPAVLTLAVVLEHSAREYPDRVAIVSDELRMTYREVDAASSRFAATLVERGLRPGDRVALSCPNGAWFPIAHFAILKAGLTTVPLNVLLTEREVIQHLEDSGARAYVCHGDTPELALERTGRAAFERVEECEHFLLLPFGKALLDVGDEAAGTSLFEAVRRAETDTAVVLYTSGTTGRPKGAELTHSNLVHNALLANHMYAITSSDIQLVAVPMFHTFGLTILLHAGFAAGATLVMTRHFNAAEVLALMYRECVTLFAGVPTMYWGMVQAAEVAPAQTAAVSQRLRVCISGGAALPVELLAAFEQRFAAPVLEGYGLSETSPIAASNRVGLARRTGSVGRPVWGIEIRVVREDGTIAETNEPGEILIRGHNVMKGYLRHPEATREAIDEHDWFRSGDIGRLDADGYLFVVDRRKDIIIRGGFNVYPRELEEVLLSHPEVSLAAVVGVPHERNGEEVKAFIVRKPGTSLTEAELIGWCQKFMATYKYPRMVEFREHLPVSATGKVLKRELTGGPVTE
jgi:long-chain acyl-CoA synthetase